MAVAAVAVLCALLPASAVAAGPDPGGYQQNDYKGFHDILPAGTNGLDNLSQLLAFQADHNAYPPHSNDQLGMYRDLVYGAAAGLHSSDISKYYKDSSFGYKPDDAGRIYSPCTGATVVRDASFGVPHVYGATRAAAMCALGYVGAEDRLFLMDALRHAGRGDLSSFAGGAPGNREMDRGVWADTPYTEADLQRQVNYTPPGFESEANQLRSDAANYVAGVNKYIGEARLDVTKMPGEYAATLHVLGPADWKVTDLISEASLIGGIFGNGGGNELGSALTLQAAQKRYGERTGRKVWRDFREAEDPEAPMTARSGNFPYMHTPKASSIKGRALPDVGTLQRANPVVGGSPLPDIGHTISGILGGPLSFPNSASNALLVSARESKSGHPVAVMGPQVAYFMPQILMEQDVHAPTLDARGAAFAGVNLFVQLGRGRDYSWSATSAGQDVIDTFSVPLCNTDGSTPTMDSDHYMFRGECLPFEVLTHVNSWIPNAADTTPPGSETLRSLRTKIGIVAARGKVHGHPVAFTRLRSTYFHEIDSALGFSKFNDPNQIHGVRDFQRAAYDIGFTFNWLYADNKHIGYFNSGANPVRNPHADPNFPVDASYAWKNWDPDTYTAALTPFSQHPQVIDQSYITSWNNKEGPGYHTSDSQWSFGPTFRVDALNQRVQNGIRGSRKMSLPQLITAMEDAGTVDLRGARALPYAIRIIKRHRITDPKLRHAVAMLGKWSRSGAHRRDLNKDGTYDDAASVKLMDAWWPRWINNEFKRPLRADLFSRLLGMNRLDDTPNNHLGSAYDGGFYNYANKDLRDLLGTRVRGPYSRDYCGDGHVKKCRRLLLSSLKRSMGVNPYGQNAGCGLGDEQMCFDAIIYRTVGGISVPHQPWVNRPTYQQAVEIQGHR